MPDLTIKPNAGSGNKIIIQDQAGEAVLTSADSGATIANATLNSPTMVTPALGTPASGVVTNLTGTFGGTIDSSTTFTANANLRLIKAWVHGNNETIGTIQESFNVSTIDDDGTGLTQVHFTNAMSNTQYCALLGSARHKSDSDTYVKATNESYTRDRTTSAIAFTTTYTDNSSSSHQDAIKFSCAILSTTAHI